MLLQNRIFYLKMPCFLCFTFFMLAYIFNLFSEEEYIFRKSQRIKTEFLTCRSIISLPLLDPIH